MSSQKRMLTRKQLLKRLLQKHNRFLEEYSNEFNILHKILVLEEKQDLLDHWIEDAEAEDDRKKLRSYMKQKKRNDKEMSQIKKELEGALSTENYDLRQRHEFLKKCMDSHREALDYWISHENE